MTLLALCLRVRVGCENEEVFFDVINGLEGINNNLNVENRFGE